MEWVAGSLALDVVVGVQNFSDPQPSVTVSLLMIFATGRAVSSIAEGGPDQKAGWTCTASNRCLQVFRAVFQLSTNDYIIPDGFTSTSLSVRSSTNDGTSSRVMATSITFNHMVNNQQMATWPSRTAYGVSSYAQSGFPYGDTPSSMTHNSRWSTAWPKELNDTFRGLTVESTTASKVGSITWLAAGVVAGVYNGSEPPALTLLDAASDKVPCPQVRSQFACKDIPTPALDTLKLPDGDYVLFVRGDSYIPSNDPALVAYNKNRAARLRASGGTLSTVTLLEVTIRNTKLNAPPPPSPPGAPPVPVMPKPNPPPGVVFFNGTQKIPPPTQVFFVPSNCTGWLEKRSYMEAQAWFTRPGMDITFDATHLHVGACLPHKQMVAGKLPIDLLIQKHNFMDNHSRDDVEIGVTFQWTGGRVTLRLSASGTVSTWQDCAPFSVVCKKVLTVWIDTRPINNAWAIPDGVNKLTISARTTMNDGKQDRRLGAQIDAYIALANNKATEISTMNFGISQLSVMGFPWAYTHAELQPNLPIAPLSGTWDFWTRHMSVTANANVTGVFVSIDPVFHGNVTKGKVLVDADSVDLPEACAPSDRHINCYPTHSVDTTKLTDGAHKLFIRTDSFVGEDDPVLTAINSKMSPENQIAGGTFSAVSLLIFQSRNLGSASNAEDNYTGDDEGATLDWTSVDGSTHGAYGNNTGNGTSSGNSTSGGDEDRKLFIPPDELQVPIEELDEAILTIAAEQVVPMVAALESASYDEV